MSRQLRSPLLPTTPGEWLRCFRSRSQDNESSTALDSLSHALGVSPKTIRRWETGRAQPSQQDLINFASFFRLTPLQRHFLNRAFSNMRYGSAPVEPDVLREQAIAYLTMATPAYLLDRFFYVQAWNSLVAGIEGSTIETTHPNFLGRVRTDPRLRSWAVDHDSLVRNLTATLWIGSGRACGMPAYVDTVEELSRIPGFRERWASLAVPANEGISATDVPHDIDVPHAGRFRLVASKVEFPPTHYLVQYVPLDDDAWRYVSSLRGCATPKVHFAE